jgi:hypothetical protein
MLAVIYSQSPALATEQLEIAAITAIKANRIRAIAFLSMFSGGLCCWRM